MRGPEAIEPKHRTLAQTLEAAARSEAALTFLDARERETRLTFAQLLARARRVAGALASLGVRRGDRVALILPTSPAFADAFFGTLLAGAVAVPLYPPARLGRLEEYHRRTARMIERAGVRLVLTDARIRRLLGETVAAARPALGCRVVEELRGFAAGEPGAGPADLALIQYSSGTTVDPKPVALTHANVLANLAAIDPSLRGGAVGVCWLPLYHDMGLIGCLLMAAYHPGQLTLIPPEVFLARPALWLRAVSRARATISPAPNFAYGLCLKRVRDEELEGVDLSSWRLALCGAEPVSPRVLREFARRFAPWGFDARALTPVYGLAEASLAVTFSPPGRPLATRALDAERLAAKGEVHAGSFELASVGRPLAGVELEVRGEDGRPLADGQAGRVHVRSPSVMAGYFGDPRGSAEALAGGWLDTGDVGFVEGGELYVCGRAKDVVILRGANHTPQEFEECLRRIAGLREGCAVAFGIQPPGADGEELAILAELAAGAAPTPALEDQIRVEVLAATGIRPHTVRLLAAGTLPRTSSGKLRRAEARRQLLAGELCPPGAVTPVRLAGALVRSGLAYARLRLKG